MILSDSEVRRQLRSRQNMFGSCDGRRISKIIDTRGNSQEARKARVSMGGNVEVWNITSLFALLSLFSSNLVADRNKQITALNFEIFN